MLPPPLRGPSRAISAKSPHEKKRNLENAFVDFSICLTTFCGGGAKEGRQVNQHGNWHRRGGGEEEAAKDRLGLILRNFSLLIFKFACTVFLVGYEIISSFSLAPPPAHALFFRGSPPPPSSAPHQIFCSGY